MVPWRDIGVKAIAAWWCSSIQLRCCEVVEGAKSLLLKEGGAAARNAAKPP
jgi:hypothetical protein